MTPGPVFVLQFLILLLFCCGCKKDADFVREPRPLWSRPYFSDAAPGLVSSDATRLYSFANSQGGGLLAHTKTDGGLAWKLALSQFQGAPVSAYFAGGVFILHSHDTGNHFYAVDLNTGQMLWEKYFPNTDLYSVKGHLGSTFFFCKNDGMPGQFGQFDAQTGVIHPLQAFSFPGAWESVSDIFGRVNPAGDTLLYQIRYVDGAAPQSFLSAWNLSAGSLWKEVPLDPLPAWVDIERLVYGEGSDCFFVREKAEISAFNAGTLEKRWAIPDNNAIYYGKIWPLDDLLLHRPTDASPGNADVLEAATGISRFSFATNSDVISGKTARLGSVIYHYNDPLYGFLGPEKNARLRAFQSPGGALRWDVELKSAEGGEERGVVYCDAIEKAVFVITDNTILRYEPAR